MAANEEYEQLWAEEAEARYDDFLAGRTTAIDGDEVFAKARNRFRPLPPKAAEDL